MPPQQQSTPIPRKLFGYDLTDWVEQPDSGAMQLSPEGAIIITRKWKTNYPGVEKNTPSIHDPDPGGFNATCFSVNVERVPPNIAIITAQYQGYYSLPPDIFEFSNSRMERPIELHPKFEDTGVFPTATKIIDMIGPSKNIPIFKGFRSVDSTAANNKFRGIESFIVGNAQWRRTSYSETPDFDQTDVGQLSAPYTGTLDLTETGFPDPTNANKRWLKVEKTCRNMMMGSSFLWIRQEVWQYNSLGWLPEIYTYTI